MSHPSFHSVSLFDFSTFRHDLFQFILFMIFTPIHRWLYLYFVYLTNTTTTPSTTNTVRTFHQCCPLNTIALVLTPHSSLPQLTQQLSDDLRWMFVLWIIWTLFASVCCFFPWIRCVNTFLNTYTSFVYMLCTVATNTTTTASEPYPFKSK